jgi:hypothetical protein
MGQQYTTNRERNKPYNKYYCAGKQTFDLHFLFLIFIGLFGSQPAFGQDSLDDNSLKAKLDSIAPSGHTPHVYRMNYWVSGAFSLVATAADIYAIPNIIKAKEPLTDDELRGISKNTHNEFDEWALRQDPSKRDQYYKASDYVLPAIIVSAAALGFDKNIRKDWARIFMMYYEMHSVTFSLYNFSPFGPAFQNKIRPYSYYNYYTDDERRTGNNRNSQYSGHTATAAASTFFMVKVYTDYHPEIGRKKYLLYGLATIPPLVEGYLRMKALAHFPSDILIGLVIGGVCGVVIPDLHKFRKHHVRLGVINAPMGPGLSLSWRPNYEKTRTFNNYSPGID